MATDNNKKILKVNSNEFKNSSRDERELNVYKELGASVLVVAKGPQERHKQIDNVNGFDVMRLGTRPLKYVPNLINRIVSVFIWARIIRGLNADVLSGRDLEGLLISYLSTLFLSSNCKPKIVYDSHEFEMGRNRVLNSKIKTFIVKRMERFLMTKCCVAIFVSDSIKQKVVETYKTKTPTIVVRNIPPKWKLSDSDVENKKKELNDYFKKDYFVVMYHGALLPYRGIENMLDAASHIEDVACVLLGMSNGNYLNELKERVSSLGMERRVLFHEAVPLINLGSYIAATNVGFAAIEPRTLSYYYSLPNKLFENIQSLTPIIVSNFPDMSELVNKYRIGIAVNPSSVEEIELALRKIKDDVSCYSQFKSNLRIAREELCWEVEKEILAKAYYNYF